VDIEEAQIDNYRACVLDSIKTGNLLIFNGNSPETAAFLIKGTAIMGFEFVLINREKEEQDRRMRAEIEKALKKISEDAAKGDEWKGD